MRARVIAAVLAAVLAVVGVVALLSYASGAQQRAYGNAKLVTVYRVSAPIDENSDSATVTNAVEKVQLPKSAVAAGAISSLSDIAGLKTTVALEPGELLLPSRFSKSGASTDAAVDVPKGLQQVSVQLTSDESGPVKPGDDVGIVVSSQLQTADGKTVDVSKMIADQVLVTKVSSATGGQQQSGAVITLAVTEKQASQIATADNYGKVRLTLQDDQTDSMSGVAVTLPQLFK